MMCVIPEIRSVLKNVSEKILFSKQKANMQSTWNQKQWSKVSLNQCIFVYHWTQKSDQMEYISRCEVVEICLRLSVYCDLFIGSKEEYTNISLIE